MWPSLSRLFERGILTLPTAFLARYKALGLSDDDFVLLLHLVALVREGIDFPTPKILAERMKLGETAIGERLKFLLDSGWIRIDVHFDGEGRVTEAFDVTPFFERMTQDMLHHSPDFKGRSPAQKTTADSAVLELAARLETAFGRPLSPLDLEIVSHWIKNDRLSTPLIEAAIEEALVVGKNSVRYVDRILFHWVQQGIATPEAAKQYTLRFREKQFAALDAKQPPEPAPRYPQFNWLAYADDSGEGSG
ncbi:MAG: DnaD domain protein [Hydrogenibacillus sp.]|nr:DnaD domain protein [Hydrogenibacillus sp.]